MSSAAISLGLVILLLGAFHIWSVVESKVQASAKMKEAKKINGRFRK